MVFMCKISVMQPETSMEMRNKKRVLKLIALEVFLFFLLCFVIKLMVDLHLKTLSYGLNIYCLAWFATASAAFLAISGSPK